MRINGGNTMFLDSVVFLAVLTRNAAGNVPEMRFPNLSSRFCAVFRFRSAGIRG
jgi:hypothetical protein